MSLATGQAAVAAGSIIGRDDSRLHYMDALRSILMVMGIILHASQVFNQGTHWLIHSPHTTPYAWFLAGAIHTFRMPAFFIISGFFCFLTLQKYGHEYFLKKRLTRILIPLLSTGIIINSLQTLVLVKTGWIKNFALSTYLTEGQWIAHLWFLNLLILYVLLLYSVAYLLKKKIVFTENSRLLSTRQFTLLLFILPLFTVGLTISGKIIPIHTMLFFNIIYTWILNPDSIRNENSTAK